MYHILFIRLPGEGDLGCFQFLLMTNKAAVNFHQKVFVCEQISFLLGIFLGVGLLGCMIITCSLYKKPPNSFSKWQHHFHPFHNVQALQVVHSLTRTQCC